MKNETRMKNVGMQRQQKETEGNGMKVNGVEFDVELEWDLDGRIEMMRVFLKGSEVELSDVLSEKVLNELEEKGYKDGRDDYDKEDYREDR